MLRVVLIGGGNIAHHLFKVLSTHNAVALIQCYNRTLTAIETFKAATSITDDLNEIADADLYILAVKDDAITEVSNNLPFSGRFVVHTSGNKTLDALNNKNRRGVFYPLQSLSKEKDIEFLNVPLCLEAENQKDLDTLTQIAESISNKVFQINSEQRKTIHLAAVFVNNFVNHLYKIGNDICLENNIPFEVLEPLIVETSAKIKEMSPLEAQTGPARRNDHATINSHLELLTNDNQKEIYRILTTSILNTYGREKL
ncbi:DUF2520 domain-containing protein [Galbibacter sp. BG1]|uniref:Rossmann-like and DUF2520 domain-containing protein n=1 Tax=Galbibacter sp. BG1 TaxID=1170699 RepID=UPI0015BA218D|nr:DUF2520 domain-containing protein [Galbibacter sp. BG1]QLE02668.1 DUF2520 domain-containing protein [Galbibacter sp. BG1]